MPGLKIVIFGATGMIGGSALRAALASAAVSNVLCIVRGGTRQSNPKLREIIRDDWFDYSDIAEEFLGFDACFFCLGISSAGMTEAAYRRITYEFTLTAATMLARVSPNMTFVYVSGAGTDSTGAGKTMWARIKGQTENALLALPFKAAYMLRPGVIQPMHGIKSKTKSYRAIYTVFGFILPALRMMFPNRVSSADEVAQSMLALALHGYERSILEVRDINQIAAKVSPTF